MNSRKTTSVTSSKYKGVTWDKRRNTWNSSVMKNYKRYHLGYFFNEDDAARAYNIADKKHHGKFAYLNTISK